MSRAAGGGAGGDGEGRPGVKGGTRGAGHRPHTASDTDWGPMGRWVKDG